MFKYPQPHDSRVRNIKFEQQNDSHNNDQCNTERRYLKNNVKRLSRYSKILLNPNIKKNYALLVKRQDVCYTELADKLALKHTLTMKII